MPAERVNFKLRRLHDWGDAGLAWFPDRKLVFIGDGVYSAKNLPGGLNPRVTYVGSNVEKRFLLQAALPDALRGVDRCPRSAQYAETVAEAYLHLSGGRVSPELLLAEQWFRRVRRLCPVKAWVETTLVEIEQVRSQEDHSAGTHLSDRR